MKMEVNHNTCDVQILQRSLANAHRVIAQRPMGIREGKQIVGFLTLHVVVNCISKVKSCSQGTVQAHLFVILAADVD